MSSYTRPNSCIAKYLFRATVRAFRDINKKISLNMHNQKEFEFYKQSIELSGMSPRGGAFPGMEVGGSMVLGAGSTFSESSILSIVASQLMWNRVTRGLDAKMFLCSCV